MKIRLRLFLTFLLLVGLGFYLLVRWILDDLRPRYLATMEESMVDAATLLAAGVSRGTTPDGAIPTADLRAAFDDAGRRRFLARIYEVTKTNLNLRVYVTDRHGVVLFDSDGGKDEGRDYSRWNDVFRALRGEYGARTTPADPRDLKTSVLHVAAPVTADGRIVGALTLCKPAGSVTQFMQAAKRKIVWGGALAALGVVLLGMAVSSWIVRPIEALTAYARAVRDGRRAGLPQLGRSEIGELGQAFEQMRDALEGRQYVERYVQTLTHEMKSPLSAIRGAAELLEEEMPSDRRRQFLTNVRTETARMQDLVDRLLQLSEIESRKTLRDAEDIALADLVREVALSLAPMLVGRRIRLTTEMDEGLSVRGERFLVRQSLANLMQNAVDFSPDGGAIAVRLEQRAGWVEIRVRDGGPGLPGYALEKAFDRFYSLPHPGTGRKGTGLGLTFAREAIALHGGEVTLQNRPDGGAEAVIRLPFKAA